MASNVVFINRWPEVKRDIDAAITRGLRNAGQQMKFRLIAEMHGPKSGRFYGPHQASAPGQPPATDTEQLERGINDVLIDPKTVEVGASAPYSVVLEFGGGHVAPRPMWVPVAEAMADEIGRIISTEIRSPGSTGHSRVGE